MAKSSKSELEHYAYQYGTDAQFLKWITMQPSIIDYAFNQYNPDRNIACHVRRIKDGSGMGIKPPFSAVPMTQWQHDIQTKDGEAAVIRRRGYIISDEDAEKWFDERRDEMVAKWIFTRRSK